MPVRTIRRQAVVMLGVLLLLAPVPARAQPSPPGDPRDQPLQVAVDELLTYWAWAFDEALASAETLNGMTVVPPGGDDDRATADWPSVLRALAADRKRADDVLARYLAARERWTDDERERTLLRTGPVAWAELSDSAAVKLSDRAIRVARRTFGEVIAAAELDPEILYLRTEQWEAQAMDLLARSRSRGRSRLLRGVLSRRGNELRQQAALLRGVLQGREPLWLDARPRRRAVAALPSLAGGLRRLLSDRLAGPVPPEGGREGDLDAGLVTAWTELVTAMAVADLEDEGVTGVLDAAGLGPDRARRVLLGLDGLDEAARTNLRRWLAAADAGRAAYEAGLVTVPPAPLPVHVPPPPDTPVVTLAPPSPRAGGGLRGQVETTRPGTARVTVTGGGGTVIYGFDSEEVASPLPPELARLHQVWTSRLLTLQAKAAKLQALTFAEPLLPFEPDRARAVALDDDHEWRRAVHELNQARTSERAALRRYSTARARLIEEERERAMRTERPTPASWASLGDGTAGELADRALAVAGRQVIRQRRAARERTGPMSDGEAEELISQARHWHVQALDLHRRTAGGPDQAGLGRRGDDLLRRADSLTAMVRRSNPGYLDRRPAILARAELPAQTAQLKALLDQRLGPQPPRNGRLARLDGNIATTWTTLAATVESAKLEPAQVTEVVDAAGLAPGPGRAVLRALPVEPRGRAAFEALASAADATRVTPPPVIVPEPPAAGTTPDQRAGMEAAALTEAAPFMEEEALTEEAPTKAAAFMDDTALTEEALAGELTGPALAGSAGVGLPAPGPLLLGP